MGPMTAARGGRSAGKGTQKRDPCQAYNRWMANDEKPIVQRTKAALEQAEGKTIKTWKYTDDGQAIVLFFIDGTNLQVEMTYDREIKGVRNEPFLMAHLGRKKAK
jgi:hypothetical protein